MSDDRFNRIEIKVDKIDEKVNGVKIDITELKSDMRQHMRVIEEHVAGDNKIIEHISPMLPIFPDLADMVKDYTFKKEKDSRRMAVMKLWSLRIGLAATTIGLLTALVSFFS